MYFSVCVKRAVLLFFLKKTMSEKVVGQLVLRNIFAYLRPDDRDAVYGVCKSWRVESRWVHLPTAYLRALESDNVSLANEMFVALCDICDISTFTEPISAFVHLAAFRYHHRNAIFHFIDCMAREKCADRWQVDNIQECCFKKDDGEMQAYLFARISMPAYWALYNHGKWQVQYRPFLSENVALVFLADRYTFEHVITPNFFDILEFPDLNREDDAIFRLLNACILIFTSKEHESRRVRFVNGIMSLRPIALEKSVAFILRLPCCADIVQRPVLYQTLFAFFSQARDKGGKLSHSLLDVIAAHLEHWLQYKTNGGPPEKEFCDEVFAKAILTESPACIRLVLSHLPRNPQQLWNQVVIQLLDGSTEMFPKKQRKIAGIVESLM
jgi:hypothetical protein